MDTADVLVERDGVILTVIFNRPDQNNSFSADMHVKLAEAWSKVGDDPGIRAIIITGNGLNFNTGMDVAAHVARGGHRSWKDIGSAKDFAMTPHQSGLSTPVIVAVNGTCSAGGLHFLCDADIVIASTGATFFDNHVALGQVASLEPIGLLPRIGLGNVLKMVTLGPEARLSAADALRICLVDEVVAPDALRPRARELAMLAARGSPTALAKSKKAIWEALERPMTDALQNGWEVLLAHQSHPDCTEGPLAYVERREPRWQ